ncbi:alpha-1,3-arabinosyltransferase XAT3-like [Phoenix dactylifera]|uniref:Alpha-1,3-arabinosyltransferase XAT3-like n=1 Tax=Phoenix dactylifera TaxID=42345 RepID=A0A8B7BG16_PHODC|nr:alpha-1,3-arabinosyltransferase XAT3-like [Phoenix dactylifera]
MANKMKSTRSSGRVESRSFRLAVFIIGCLVLSTFVVVSKPQIDPFLTRSSEPLKPIGRNNLGAKGTADSPKLGMKGENMNRGKPLCHVSERRGDLCIMDGDIRIHQNTSSIILVEPSGRNELWRVRPYPRKGADNDFNQIRELTVKSSKEAIQCTINHSIPAIVFSVSGYTGNLFHDFTDLLVPLFLTARQFNGEVQFIVTDVKHWWIDKYLPVFRGLSKYQLIEFGRDDQVHCFKHMIVGLRRHKELSIDPTKAPHGYSMVHFTQFMRSTYELGRDTVARIEEYPHKKPRLLIISRKQSRAITNVKRIAQMAEELGYEVVAAEANSLSNITRFAQIVNSCDVMMGVHGAGLTNMVFLPPQATVIQIVPWGRLETIARKDFGDPAKDMKLNYLQYSISAQESTLMKLYPRNHPVFKNPSSFHNRGWDLVKTTFMEKQNVKLDLSRFRDVLWKALENLMQ